MRLGRLLEALERDSLHEGIRLTQKDYNALLSDSRLLMGFEAEFVYDTPVRLGDPDTYEGREYMKGEEFYHLADYISREFGVKVEPNEASRDDIRIQKDPGKWYLDYDASVMGNEAPEDTMKQGLELTSPALPIQESLKALEMTLDWIAAGPDTFTSHNTGLHINISYQGATEETVDPLKLMLLLGEHAALEEFARDFNHFTEPHAKALVNFAVQFDFAKFIQNKTPIEFFIRQFKLNFPADKYHTFNWGKFITDGYMEFRIMGNRAYENQFNRIRRNALNYAALLKVAHDPQAYRKEYMVKLYKFLQQIAAETERRYAAYDEFVDSLSANATQRAAKEYSSST